MWACTSSQINTKNIENVINWSISSNLQYKYQLDYRYKYLSIDSQGEILKTFENQIKFAQK